MRPATDSKRIRIVPKLPKKTLGFVVATLALLVWAGIALIKIANAVSYHETIHSGRQELPRLRLVIITSGRRVHSLDRLLRSACALESEGDRIDVDVWIDVPKGNVSGEEIERRRALATSIAQLTKNGTYRHGVVAAHVWTSHMGLRGQWLDAWHASIPGGLSAATPEIGLILEDDLELSRYAWRWLKAAHAAYGDDPRVAGFSLQRLELCAAHCDAINGGPDNAGGGFLYPVVGSWGYSPTARSFSRFRQWYYSLPPGFQPHVEGILPTLWYQERQQSGTQHSMWTIYHVHYTHTHEDKYTVYVKCEGNATLAVNHREPGLNYAVKEASPHGLLNSWSPALTAFVPDPFVLNYSATVVAGQGNQAPMSTRAPSGQAALGGGFL